MKPTSALSRSGRPFSVAVCLALLMANAPLHAALTVGALAVVGYNDTASDSSGTDSYALVATETINSGEEVYITNNGWNNTTRQFDGVWVSGDVGAGAENLVKLTINSTILAGTIIKSSDLSNSSFSWTTSGSIPMPLGATGSFSDLDLKYGGTSPNSYGDEIYIFQASSSSNPLLNVAKFIYAIDFGDRFAGDLNWYDPQSSGSGGNLPDGLVSTNPLLNGDSYITVETISDQENSQPNDNTAMAMDPISERYGGTFGLDLSHGDVVALQTSGGTKAEWLRMINNSSHWDSTSVIFDNSGIYASGLNFSAVPEPSRGLLALLGCGLAMLRRRR